MNKQGERLGELETLLPARQAEYRDKQAAAQQVLTQMDQVVQFNFIKYPHYFIYQEWFDLSFATYVASLLISEICLNLKPIE